MEYSLLANIVKNNFVPVVLVLCSPDVEQMCKKSETNLLRLFSKFAFSPQPVRVKTLGETSYEIKGFQVRFVTLTDLENRSIPQDQQEKPDSTVNQYLQQVASYHATEKIYADFALRDSQDVPLLHRALQGKDPTPWYSYYRWEYLRSLGITEFEFFEHPVACIIAISSQAEKPNEAATELFDEKNPPQVFKSGIMDVNIPKFYLLVHDGTTDNSMADKKLTILKNTFDKTRCGMIKLNSLAEKNEQGTYLSQLDWQGLEIYVKEFAFKGVIPHLERSIASLNDFLEKSKKGIGTQLKDLFGWSKGKSEAKAPEIDLPVGNMTYSLSSRESSQKRLADYLFMLSDFNEAFNMYKTAAKAYSNDKSWKFFASANEMAGLCTFLIEPTKKDLETFFDNAWQNYARDNLNRFAARTGMLIADIMRVRRNLPLAAAKLMRTAEKENDKLCSAMLYEQAAFCFLYNTPPQYRKYTFRLALAGQCYNAINQIKHSLRCYSAAYSVYEAHNWQFVDDHFHYVLARNSFILNNLDNALLYICKLLEKNNQSPNKQSSYLREFLHIFSKAAVDKGLTMPNLPLPVIVNESVTVFLRDYPPKSPMQEEWKSMEKALKNDGKKKKIVPKWRPPKARKQPVPKLAVIGETISVEVDVKNPLQIPIQFTELRLSGVHTPEPNSEATNDTDPAFKVVPFDVVLGPKDTQKLKFSIIPLKKGILNVKAIAFKLGDVSGCREFRLPQKRLNDTQEHMKGVFYEPNMDLTFKITGAMPLMDVEFLSFPTTMYQGQLEQVNVQFKNSGSSKLNHVKVKLNHPSFFSFVRGNKEQLSAAEPDPSIIHFDITSLAPGESVTLPLWIRAHKVGTFQFLFLFFYQSEEQNTQMVYRLERITKQLKIWPSLKATTSTNFSYTNIHAYLLDLEIANAQETISFNLQSMSAFSTAYKIDPLSFSPTSPSSNGNSLVPSSPDMAPVPDMFSVGVSQSTNMYFKIIPLNEEELASRKGDVYETTVPFPTQEKVVNPLSSTCPYSDFLRREKYFIAAKKKTQQQPVHILHNSNNNQKEKEEEIPASSLMDFTVLWQAKDSEGKHIFGQYNICNVPFLTPNTAEQAVSENNALRFSVESPRKVLHDFNSATVCVVPVVFHISNQSATSNLSFLLETLRPHEQFDSGTNARSNSLSLQKRSQYFWSGMTQHNVNDLAPGQKLELTTLASFCRPGVYNLNRYKFSIRDAKKKQIVQQILSPFQHLIIIEDQNEVSENSENTADESVPLDNADK